MPIFESPDEPHHWLYTEYIHSHLALPPYNSEYLEAPQAPLYYLLLAPLAVHSERPLILRDPVDEKGLGFSFGNMPHLQIDGPCFPHFFVNCRADLHRYWPIRRVRLATGLLALVAVLFTALGVLELTSSMSSAIAAGALMGFLPQFTFRGASVNNDSALVCFSAVATYFMIRMIMRGFERGPAIWGAVAVALAFLSKINAAILVPPFLGCLLLSAPDWRTRFRRSSLLLLSGLIILPWILRNKIVYDDFLGASKIAQTVPLMVNPRPITDPYFRTTFVDLLVRSFFGYFGWMNIRMPGPIYKGYVLLFALAILGSAGVAVSRRGKYGNCFILLSTIPPLSLGFLLYLNLTYPQPQGRLLYPSLSAVVVLACSGLAAMSRLRMYVAALVVIGSMSVNAYALAKVIYPAYWAAKPMHTQSEPTIPGNLMNEAVRKTLMPGVSYAQSFVAEHAGLSGVEMKIATQGGRNRFSVQVSVSNAIASFPFATVEIPLDTLANPDASAHIDFRPVSNSAGKEYFLSIFVSALPTSGQVAIPLTRSDVYTKGQFFEDGKPVSKDADLRISYTRACWRCP
ncbi:MAG: ArnT family glycosyltransferase [Bryobacteraceae bacterium]